MNPVIVLLMLGVLVPCNADLFQKCFLGAYASGSSKPPSIANHCSTIKNTSDCLGHDPSQSGKLLDYMRFYILEHAMFDIGINLCSPYDYSNLKRAVSSTDVFKRYGACSVENAPEEDDVLKQCVLRVHLSTKKYYIKKKIKGIVMLLCDDARDLAKFYKTKAKELKCKPSRILDAFVSTIKHVVNVQNSEIIKRLKITCPSSVASTQ